MYGITVSKAAEICGGRLFSPAAEDAELTGIITDSRAVIPGCLFVAYRGERTDGHRYIASVLRSGAACALAETVPEDVDGPVIVVDNVQEAVEKIAKAFRAYVTIPVFAITGSVGKTTAKEMVSSVLSRHYCVHKTKGNLNSTIGLPVSLTGIDRSHEVAVLELGINHFGEMDRLGAMARPDIILYTMIGHAHLEFLGDLDGVFCAKTEVLAHMKEDALVIYNGDDPVLCRLKERSNTLSYGRGKNCDIRADHISADENGFLRFEILAPGRHMDVHLKAFGDHMLYAALEGAAAGIAMGLTDEEITEGIAAYTTVGRRFALTDTGFLRLIDDCYNANPDSVSSSIRSLAELPGRHVAVLGDMLELGENAAQMHREIGAFAREKGVDQLLLTGKLSRYTCEGYGSGAHYYESKKALIEALPGLLRKDDAVLVKASLGAGFAEVAEFIKIMDQPCVFLDLDNTVLDFSTAEENSLKTAFSEFNLPFSSEILARFRKINLYCWEMLEQGRMKREEVLYGRFEKLFEELGFSADVRPVQDRYEVLLQERHYFMPGAEELLEDLFGRYRLFIVSNGNAKTQDARIASAGIAKYFEKIFVSEKLGAEKPSMEFFRLCFEEVPGLDLAKAVIVGDSLTSDIRGGINTGMTSIWLNPKGTPMPSERAPDYTVSSLSEIPPLLDELFLRKS